MKNKMAAFLRGSALRPGWPAALLVLLLAVPPAAAIPIVSIDPPTKLVGPGLEFDLDIVINEEADTFSNFQVIFQFDPTVIEFVEAFEGSIYAETGLNTWFHVEEESTGTWEVFEVLFPGSSFVVAPGALAHLRFRALADGVTPVEFLSVVVTDIARNPIVPLIWTNGVVFVDEATGTDQSPMAGWFLGEPAPNPSRGATRVLCLRPPGAGTGESRLSVYDTRGRLVSALSRAPGAADPYVEWDGRDRWGRTVPSGLYFFLLETPETRLTRKVYRLR